MFTEFSPINDKRFLYKVFLQPLPDLRKYFYRTLRFRRSRNGSFRVTKKLLTAFIILIINAYCICSFESIGDCLTKCISVESVLQTLKEKQELILIDVRNHKEFERFRIPGSVNIPLFAVKTKTFLKPKPLVLINEGHSYKQLMDECLVLSESGFIVSILDGGLYQWRRKGGPLEGDVFAQRELNEITPQTFLSGKGHENWIVVDVSKSEHPGTDHQNVQRIHIPFANDPKEFTAKLKDTKRNYLENKVQIPPYPPLLKGGKAGFTSVGNDSENNPITPSPLVGEGGGERGFLSMGNYRETSLVSIVICDEKGKVYEEIERHLKDAGIENVLYLKGGLEGYKAFEKQQISMQQEKKVRTGKTVKTNKNCTACP